MVISSAPFSPKILVTTDLSDLALSALPYALDEARALNASVTLFHMLSSVEIQFAIGADLPSAEYVEKFRAEAIGKAELELKKLAEKHLVGVRSDVKVLQAIRHVGDEVIDYAKQEKFGMIIMASHGHGFLGRAVLGSVTEHVLRYIPAPMLVVPADKSPGQSAPRLPYRNIIVTTDLSNLSESAFAVARYEAERSKANLMLLHVVEDLFAPGLLRLNNQQAVLDAESIQRDYHAKTEEHLFKLGASIGLKPANCKMILKEHSVAATIADFAKEHSADLIVVAARGAGQRSTWLGTNAERIVRQAPCAVIIVPEARDSDSWIKR